VLDGGGSPVFSGFFFRAGGLAPVSAAFSNDYVDFHWEKSQRRG
jgi:hypothetical protein